MLIGRKFESGGRHHGRPSLGMEGVQGEEGVENGAERSVFLRWRGFNDDEK